MSEKKDVTSLLQSIEDDYRHDLAIHLYSTYLLHLKDPFFPRRGWSGWPLTYTDVPDPKSTEIYINEANPFNDALERPSASQSMRASLEPSLPETTPDDDVMYRYYRNKKMYLQEELTDPQEDLRLELRALLARKLNEKANNVINQRKKAVAMYKPKPGEPPLKQAVTRDLFLHQYPKLALQRIIDFPEEAGTDGIPRELVDRLQGKIDGLVKSLLDVRSFALNAINEDTKTKIDGSSQTYRLMDWKDVMMQTPQAQAIDRCCRLFDDRKQAAKVEYEGSGSEEEPLPNYTDEYAAKIRKRVAKDAKVRQYKLEMLLRKQDLLEQKKMLVGKAMGSYAPTTTQEVLQAKDYVYTIGKK
ncbi:hypothetical protein BABINDRAFT_158970 [Babjeviella inositovora NRRL Y-12698]|uniref:Rrn9 domain-containing protein n=1 Tax=Babjeviella inositovora NRRL Y-12698 TaxID=984486 RepID=A0A1E3QXF9_9ASCO|nr:uncharacterized protein BABINDRAFT_158970 [Babjeviella inositovora NRRL Y-12698]ODQ82355.1 hypothetical protein BABINDRAFT_158970 [Babjeviella inositovora NRRL Y-12698]